MKDVFDMLLANAKPINKGSLFSVPKGLCKVCGEEREEDLLYHGGGKGALMYYPCRHSVHFANGQLDVWEDAEGNIVPLTE